MAEIEWDTGLCDCFSDCCSCVLTCLCPCYVFGRIAVIADNGQNIPGYGPCQAIIYCVLCCPGWCCCYSAYYRPKMRRRVGLQSDGCPDCLAHVCCMFCALCQEYHQLEKLGYDMATGRQKQGNNTAGANQVMQAPTTPNGMQAPTTPNGMQAPTTTSSGFQAPTTPGGMTGDNQPMSTLVKIKLLLDVMNCISGLSN